MNPYIEILNTYLDEHPPKYGCPSVDSLLSMLLCCYCQHNSMDSQAVRRRFADLDDLLAPFTIEQSDRIFDLLCSICSHYQQQAFLEGVQTGFRLYQELTA